MEFRICPLFCVWYLFVSVLWLPTSWLKFQETGPLGVKGLSFHAWRIVKKKTFVYGVKTALNARRIYSCVSRKQVDNWEIESFCHVLRNWSVLHLTLFTWKCLRRKLCACLTLITYAKAVIIDISIMPLSIIHRVRTQISLIKKNIRMTNCCNVFVGVNLNELNVKIACIQLRQ